MNIYPSHFILGSQEAPITIVMYGDYQCQSSAWWYPRVKEILADFPDQVQLVLRPYILPSHKLSYQAAKAALAAGVQNKYYEMVEILFEHALNQNLNEMRFPEYARMAGLKTEQFTRDYQYSAVQWREQINKDKQTGNEFGVDGTPCFFINDQRVHPMDVAGFKRLISDHLSGKVHH